MEELRTGTYGEFKKSMDRELQQAAEGFVRVGYLLKVARDTDVLHESGYKSVAEFAQAEYNLTKDIVSRYIAINDKYSEGGYSDRLRENYVGYGVAKLAEMLTLPDSVIEIMDPSMTRAEIQDVKKEIREEEQKTELEVMMEGRAPELEHLDDTLEQILYQYFHDHREEFGGITTAVFGMQRIDHQIDDILDVLAPSGIATKTVRIQGIGKFMLSIRGKTEEIKLLNIRSNEKEAYTWEKFIMALQNVFREAAGLSDKDGWELIYGETYGEKEKEEKKTEVAPVQPAIEKSILKQAKKPEEQREESEEKPKQEPVTPEETEPVEDEREKQEEPQEETMEDVKEETEDTEQEDTTEAAGEPVTSESSEERPAAKLTSVKEGYARQEIENTAKRLNDMLEKEFWKGAIREAMKLENALNEMIELQESEGRQQE